MISGKLNIKASSNEISEDIINAIKKKRGRKSKKELELLKKYNESVNSPEPQVNKVPKKRGRKPKGGKLIVPNYNVNDNDTQNKQSNIILHLKCKSSDIENNNNFISKISYTPNIESVKPYNDFEEASGKYFSIEVTDCNETNIQNNLENSHSHNDCCDLHKVENNNDNAMSSDDNAISIKAIWSKIKELQYKLNKNTINDKNSACFWCTHNFDNPTIYIPKFEINGNYEVYGCFCSPECATAHLFNENIDSSTKWERYALLNNIYSAIFNYEDNIKPAPSPHYILKKFYGDLTIEEFRTLLRKGKQLLIVNKPLTHILPELVEDSNNQHNANNSGKQQYKLSRNKPSYNKLPTNSKSWVF